MFLGERGKEKEGRMRDRFAFSTQIRTIKHKYFDIMVGRMIKKKYKKKGREEKARKGKSIRKIRGERYSEEYFILQNKNPKYAII